MSQLVSALVTGFLKYRVNLDVLFHTTCSLFAHTSSAIFARLLDAHTFALAVKSYPYVLTLLHYRFVEPGESLEEAVAREVQVSALMLIVSYTTA